MRTSARARLAKMPPWGMPLTTCCRNSCIGGSIPQVGTTHRLVPLQFCAGAFNGDAADLQHVGVAGHFQCDIGVLLDQEHRDGSAWLMARMISKMDFTT